MTEGWWIVSLALAYLGILFAVASYGDRLGARWFRGRGRAAVYALSLGVFCTSWTFFGAVGYAANRGMEFLAIFIGAGLFFAVGHPVLLRILRFTKSQNITSIADFVASRYGKNQNVAVLVSLCAALGTIPYIALQLKAVSSQIATLLRTASQPLSDEIPASPELALVVAFLLAIFAILFGTRHVDATEHQEGLVLAIAMESIVKLAAFCVVGIYVTWWMFNGPNDLWAQVRDAGLMERFEGPPSIGMWSTLAFLAFVCAILLPRQFHIAVVENVTERELRHARWAFPLYLAAFAVFVMPITFAGLLRFSGGSTPADMYVLDLPLAAEAPLITIAAFIGGISAGTAMVIVGSVALSIMISNNLVIPLLLRRPAYRMSDMGKVVLRVRRALIFAILGLAYAYHLLSSQITLAEIGLVSLTAIAQFAPAFFGGLFWKGATARGAIAGIASGIAMWVLTMLVPSLVDSGHLSPAILTQGLFEIGWLTPRALFGIDAEPLAHSVIWSLGVNTLFYYVVSIARGPSAMERLQANAIHRSGGLNIMAQSFRGWRSDITVEDLAGVVGRYLGTRRTSELFERFARDRGIPYVQAAEADIQLLRYAEHLLSSAIGTSSARLVLSMVLSRKQVSSDAALRLVDDASAAIQYSRDLLQTALDHAKQGVTVVDGDLQLVAWNREFVEMFQLPEDVIRLGVGLDELILDNARRGLYGPGDPDDYLAERLERIVTRLETFKTRLHPSGRVIEIRSNRMPDGGTVTTYTDVTESVAAEEILARSNETLERRVAERTLELTHLNHELARAKAAADNANASKTRFLAAASHDILQPLNAARLYASSLTELPRDERQSDLVNNLDASLQSVEEIFSTLLDISRLDTGSIRPDPSVFALDDMLHQLEVEFMPVARDKGLMIRAAPTSAFVRSDRRLLRRLLQNLVSNAIKYTHDGGILIGCRRRGAQVRIEVWDTGIGIPKSKQAMIFREFQRLNEGARSAGGAGLGLSIVERLSRVLDHRIHVRSVPGRGSVFAVEVPAAEPTASATERVAAPIGGASDLVGANVVCIDNEPRILDGMRALLGGWGCRVSAVSTTEEAMEAISAAGATPDFILADYHLDVGNGIQAIMEIRARLGADVPAILITADAGPEVRAAAAEQEVDVLAKPLKPAALRARMAQWRMRRTLDA